MVADGMPEHGPAEIPPYIDTGWQEQTRTYIDERPEEQRLVASGGVCAPIAPMYAIPGVPGLSVADAFPPISVARGSIEYVMPRLVDPAIMPEQTWLPWAKAIDEWTERRRRQARMVRNRASHRARMIRERVVDTARVARGGRAEVQDVYSDPYDDGGWRDGDDD